jgi:hypothetical protein
VANIRFNFNEVLESVLLDFVNAKMDLHKTLTAPKVSLLFMQMMFDRSYMEPRRS